MLLRMKHKENYLELLKLHKIENYIIILKFTFCNDLFSRFEQQTSIPEKQAEATDQTTIRHGHDRPSQGLV